MTATTSHNATDSAAIQRSLRVLTVVPGDEYLEQRCPGGEVRYLRLRESAPTHSRNLFAVLRK